MKKLLLFFGLLFALVGPVRARTTTTVSGTVTDLAGQVFANGTYTITFNANSIQPPYYQNGVPFTIPLAVSGALNSSGAFSGIVLASNGAITSVGTAYTFKFCSLATSFCYTLIQPVAGSSQVITAIAPPITVPANSVNQLTAYQDSEISGPQEGTLYWNYTNDTLRVFHNNAWQNAGGGGGGGSVSIDGVVVSNPNFQSNGSVQFSVSGSNIQLATGLGMIGATPLVQNGNFELPNFTVTGSIPPEGWSVLINDTGTQSYDTVNPAPNKTFSLKIHCNANSVECNMENNQASTVIPGQTNTATGYVRSDGVAPVALCIEMTQGGGSAVNDVATCASPSLSTSWVFQTVTATATSGQDYSFVFVADTPTATGPNAGQNPIAGDLWVDDIQSYQNTGVGFEDFAEISPPPNPAGGFERTFRSSATHLFSCLTSTGGNCAPSGGGGGVSSVSSGNFSPLFNVTVANPTTTPAFSFTALNANANTALMGPVSGGAGAYSFRAFVAADIPPINLASSANGGVAGVAPVPNGGTGLSVGVAGGVPCFVTTTTMASSALLPTGDFVLGGGGSACPTATFSVVPAANGGTGVASPTAHADPQAEGSSVYNFVPAGAALTGQVKTATNAADPGYLSPGVPGRTVAGLTDTILCDSATALRDRGGINIYTDASGATVTIPDAGSSGCSANFFFGVIAGPSAGSIVFNRTATSTFTLVNGATATAGATTFSLSAGQYASLYSPDNANWVVRLVNGSGGGGSVTTTGSPATGNLTCFSGSTSITNCNLAGDATTSGTSTVTVGKINGVAVPVSATALGTNASAQPVAAPLQGNGTKVQLSTGTVTTNTVSKFDANGNTINSSIVDNTTTVTTPEPIAVGASPPTCAGGGAGPGCFTEGGPSTGVAGVDNLHADTTQHALEVNNNNTGEMPVSRITCVNVTPVTVNASVTTDQNLISCTLPANTLNVSGRTLHVHAAGIYSTAAASTAVLTMKGKLCTVSGCGSGTVLALVNMPSAAIGALTITSNVWNFDFYSTTQTAGATAAFEAHGNFIVNESATGLDSVYGDGNSGTVTSIDTTGQLFLQITFTFSAASASNSATQRQGIVEVLN